MVSTEPLPSSRLLTLAIKLPWQKWESLLATFCTYLTSHRYDGHEEVWRSLHCCSWWLSVCNAEDTSHFVKLSVEMLMNPNCFTDTSRLQQEVYQNSNRRSRCLTNTEAILLLICVKWYHFLDQTVSHTVHKKAHFVAVLLVRLHSGALESLRDSQLSVLASSTPETDVPPFLLLPSP